MTPTPGPGTPSITREILSGIGGDFLKGMSETARAHGIDVTGISHWPDWAQSLAKKALSNEAVLTILQMVVTAMTVWLGIPHFVHDGIKEWFDAAHDTMKEPDEGKARARMEAETRKVQAKLSQELSKIPPFEVRLQKLSGAQIMAYDDWAMRADRDAPEEYVTWVNRMAPLIKLDLLELFVDQVGAIPPGATKEHFTEMTQAAIFKISARRADVEPALVTAIALFLGEHTAGTRRVERGVERITLAAKKSADASRAALDKTAAEDRGFVIPWWALVVAIFIIFAVVISTMGK